MSTSPNARLGQGVSRVAAIWADRLVQYGIGAIGNAYQGLSLGPDGAQEDIGRAFGQVGSRLQRQWWLDVFEEPMPPVGSIRWREQMASLPVPPPDRGPALQLETGGCILLEADDGDGVLRRA